MKTNKHRGITLIEILLYIALFGTLISTSFSIAFMLGRDRVYIADLSERQYYALSFAERVRSISSSAQYVQSPNVNELGTNLQTNKGSITNDEGEWVSSDGHKYIMAPRDIGFSRENKFVNLKGVFELRGSTTLPFSIPTFTR